jgi:hypothetical protein
MRGLPTIDEFLKMARGRMFPTNSYVSEPGWDHLYIRYGPRAALGRVFRPVIDFANIQVAEEMRGQGVFMKLVKRLREEDPELHIFVELTHPRFGNYLVKKGFVNAGGEIFQSYLLEAGSQLKEVGSG